MFEVEARFYPTNTIIHEDEFLFLSKGLSNSKDPFEFRHADMICDLNINNHSNQSIPRVDSRVDRI